MATRPLPEAAELRYGPYIEELHEFFATSGIPFGSPDDIFVVADRMREPGTFSDDLGSLVRSMVLREGGAVPHAQLLEILSLAIAGPELAHAPQQYSEPLRQLLAFVSGVMRRPWNMPPSETAAEVVPFPADTSSRPSEPIPFEPRVAVFEKMRGEQIRGLQTDSFARTVAMPDPERQTEPVSRTVAMPAPEQPETFATETMRPAASGINPTSPRRLTPVQRYFLLGSGGIMALAAVVIFLLRPTPPSEVFQVGPAPTQTAVPSHATAKTRTTGQPAQVVASNAGAASAAGLVVTAPIQNAGPVAVSAKPSAYGEAVRPQLNRRSKPTVPAGSYSTTAQPYSRTASQPAANSPAAATTYSPYSPVAPTAPYSSSGTPKTGEAAAAPIIRRPVYRDPDASIVGDLPPGQVSSAPSGPNQYFTVSSGVMAGYLLSSPNPQYPVLAHLAHIQGQVILQAVVAKDGTVSSVRVLRGNRLLRKAAQDAVRHWRYRPYQLGGKPIDIATIVTVDFHDRS